MEYKFVYEDIKQSEIIDDLMSQIRWSKFQKYLDRICEVHEIDKSELVQLISKEGAIRYGYVDDNNRFHELFIVNKKVIAYIGFAQCDKEQLKEFMEENSVTPFEEIEDYITDDNILQMINVIDKPYMQECIQELERVGLSKNFMITDDKYIRLLVAVCSVKLDYDNVVIAESDGKAVLLVEKLVPYNDLSNSYEAYNIDNLEPYPADINQDISYNKHEIIGDDINDNTNDDEEVSDNDMNDNNDNDNTNEEVSDNDMNDNNDNDNDNDNTNDDEEVSDNDMNDNNDNMNEEVSDNDMNDNNNNE